MKMRLPRLYLDSKAFFIEFPRLYTKVFSIKCYIYIFFCFILTRVCRDFPYLVSCQMIRESDQLYQQYLTIWSTQKTKDPGLLKDTFEWQYSIELIRQNKIKEKYYEKCVKKIVTKTCLIVLYIFGFILFSILLAFLLLDLITPLDYAFLIYIIIPCLVPLAVLEIGYFTELEYPHFIILIATFSILTFILIEYFVYNVADRIFQADYIWIIVVILLTIVFFISSVFLTIKNYKVYRECKNIRNDLEVLITFHIDNLLTTNEMIISYMVLYNSFKTSIINFLQNNNELLIDYIRHDSPKSYTSKRNTINYHEHEINENIKYMDIILQNVQFDLVYFKPICIYLNKYHQIEEAYYFIDMNHNENIQNENNAISSQIYNPLNDSTQIKENISINIDITRDLASGNINLNNSIQSQPSASNSPLNGGSIHLSKTPQQLYINNIETNIIRFNDTSYSSHEQHSSHIITPEDPVSSSSDSIQIPIMNEPFTELQTLSQDNSSNSKLSMQMSIIHRSDNEDGVTGSMLPSIIENADRLLLNL